jgi:signal transduction histidine kinase
MSAVVGARLLACGVAFATVVLVGIGALGAVGVGPSARDGIPALLEPFQALSILAPAVVGLLIAIRRPGNAIAWIMLLGALVLSAGAVDLLVSEGWSIQTDRATWPMLFAWPIAVAYVFPDGRLLSRRWRWVAGAAVVSFVGFMSIAVLDPEPFEKPDEAIRNPLLHNGIGEFLVGKGVWIPFWLGILASLFAGALAVVMRFRRSRGVERLQMKWLVWSASLIPIVLTLGGLSWFAFEGLIQTLLYPVLLLAEVAVAASVGIAVIRYRLYAIEGLISRTVVYVVLTLLLVGAYVAVTVPLGVAVGGGSEWVTAVATLAVALAFRPLRSRLQDLVDRRFNRARYDGVRRVRDFEDEVREGRRAPEEIGSVLAQALGDPLADVLFWLPETEAYADPAGEIVSELPPVGRARTEITRGGARTAVLLHDPALLERRDLLGSVLSAARLSIEMARLRVELRLQLGEVEASRTRIVEAGYEERRRLERDLHDGAQQRLVSLGVQVRRLQRTLPREAGILSPAFDQIVAEIGAAIGDLRQIAAGVRPARLDDGLSAALLDLARTAPVPVDVEVPGERVAASVEAAAYFVACEALTNAVKYASASKVSMRAVRANGSLLVTVSDDGVGGAVLRRGSGLAGLQDRVAAHGGTLELVSPHGEGTRIEVAIPCES